MQIKFKWQMGGGHTTNTEGEKESQGLWGIEQLEQDILGVQFAGMKQISKTNKRRKQQQLICSLRVRVS